MNGQMRELPTLCHLRTDGKWLNSCVVWLALYYCLNDSRKSEEYLGHQCWPWLASTATKTSHFPVLLNLMPLSVYRMGTHNYVMCVYVYWLSSLFCSFATDKIQAVLIINTSAASHTAGRYVRGSSLPSSQTDTRSSTPT